MIKLVLSAWELQGWSQFVFDFNILMMLLKVFAHQSQ